VGRQAFRAVTGDGDGRRIVHVEDATGRALLTLDKERGLSGTQVSHPDGAPIGSIRLDGSKIAHFDVLDMAGRRVGVLDGNRLYRKFKVLDAYGTHVGRMDKKWKGPGDRTPHHRRPLQAGDLPAPPGPAARPGRGRTHGDRPHAPRGQGLAGPLVTLGGAVGGERNGMPRHECPPVPSHSLRLGTKARDVGDGMYGARSH
jgi:hypothetical protein